MLGPSPSTTVSKDSYPSKARQEGSQAFFTSPLHNLWIMQRFFGSLACTYKLVQIGSLAAARRGWHRTPSAQVPHCPCTRQIVGTSNLRPHLCNTLVHTANKAIARNSFAGQGNKVELVKLLNAYERADDRHTVLVFHGLSQSVMASCLWFVQDFQAHCGIAIPVHYFPAASAEFEPLLRNRASMTS